MSGMQGYVELCVLSTQLFCEPKTALNYRLLKRKIQVNLSLDLGRETQVFLSHSFHPNPFSPPLRRGTSQCWTRVGGPACPLPGV